MNQQENSLENHLTDQLKNKTLYDDFFWHKVRWQAVKSVLPRDQAFKLLDIGAGTGQVGRFLARDFPLVQYHFSEPIESLNKELTQTYGSDKDFFKQGNYHGISFLTCLDVIEHIEDHKSFVRDIINKMDPGARFVATVPALKILWSQWDEILGHHRRYTKASLKELFTPFDVTINRLHYLFPEMFFAAFIRKQMARKSQKGDSEFPKLSAFVNGAFYGLSNTTRVFGPINPIGSSLLIDATKN